MSTETFSTILWLVSVLVDVDRFRCGSVLA